MVDWFSLSKPMPRVRNITVITMGPDSLQKQAITLHTYGTTCWDDDLRKKATGPERSRVRSLRRGRSRGEGC